MGLLISLPDVNSNKSGWPWDTETSKSIYDDKLEYPKITIVTPSFNQGEYIEETIRSILLQNYPNLEFIIIDGGSTDLTLHIIKKYEKWINYWESRPDMGQSHAINRGFSIAKGHIFNWINSDDFLEKDALFNVGFSYLNKTSDNLILIGNGYECDSFSQKIRKRYVKEIDKSINDFKQELFFSGNTIQQSIFFTRTLFFESGGLNPILKYPMDIELYRKFIFLKPEVILINHFLASFRLHVNSKTKKQAFNMLLEKINLLNFLKFYINKRFCENQIFGYVQNYIRNEKIRINEIMYLLKILYKNSKLFDKKKYKLLFYYILKIFKARTSQARLTSQTYWERYYSQSPTSRDLIEKVCQIYDEYWQLFLEHTKETEKKSIIEIGGYPGRYLAYLAWKFNIKPTSIDFNSDRIKIDESMVAFGLTEFNIIQADFLNYLNDKQYDFVMSIGFIEHFENFDNVLDMHIKYIKPGGRLLIIIPNMTGYIKFYKLLVDKSNLQIHNLKCMNLINFENFASRNNLSIIKLEYFGGFPFGVHQKLNLFQKTVFKFHRILFKNFLNKYLRRHPNRLFSSSIVAIFQN